MPGTRRTSIRAGVGGLAIAALVALFVALRPGADGRPAAGGGPTATPPATPPAGSPTEGPMPTGTPAQASPSPEAREVQIEVEDGRVKGPSTVAVDLGERVVLVVTADVADEVHVHGYDLLADVRPGRPARLAFVADAPGVFEVELHSSAEGLAALLLTRLEVQP